MHIQRSCWSQIVLLSVELGSTCNTGFIFFGMYFCFHKIYWMHHKCSVVDWHKLSHLNTSNMNLNLPKLTFSPSTINSWESTRIFLSLFQSYKYLLFFKKWWILGFFKDCLYCQYYRNTNPVKTITITLFMYTCFLCLFVCIWSRVVISLHRYNKQQ